MIDKIGAIIIDSKKILIAREKGLDIFFIPGGKRKAGESDLDTLTREVREELDVTVKSHKYYKTFFAKNHDGTDEVRVKAYFVDADDHPKPNSEIEELLWINKENSHQYKLGNILKIMVPELIKDEIL